MFIPLSVRLSPVLFCVSILLSACTVSRPDLDPYREDPEGTTITTAVYECADGYRFAADIDQQQAWLFMPDQTRVLPHVIAASGAKYSDGKVTFWTKGKKAVLETGRATHDRCVDRPEQARWKSAELRGVDFRAIGTDSSWAMEIVKDKEIILVMDDEHRYRFSEPTMEVNPQTAATVYRLKKDQPIVTVTLENRFCHVPGEDKRFQTTVTVRLSGQTLRGCGRRMY